MGRVSRLREGACRADLFYCVTRGVVVSINLADGQIDMPKVD